MCRKILKWFRYFQWSGLKRGSSTTSVRNKRASTSNKFPIQDYVERVVAGTRERSEALAACEGVTWSNQTSGGCDGA